MWTQPPENPGEGYRWLAQGEGIRDGDEAWTWTDPDCSASGWLTLRNVASSQKVDTGHVPVRRKGTT